MPIAVPRRMRPRPNRHAQSTDAELLAACLARDYRAWHEMVSRFRRLVYGIPIALGLQPADADEVFQHTFAELLRALPAIRNGDRIGPWLATTARRASIRLQRDERRRKRLAATWSLEETRVAAGADEEVCRIVEGERLLRIVDSLQEPCRTLLLGSLSDPPRTYREMARELGLPIGSLGPNRARCLARLRKRLRLARGSGAPLSKGPA